MSSQESAPGPRPATLELPLHIDPAVLVPGTTVYSLVDPERTPLVVVKVEPMLVCRKPDGTGVMVYAHEVITAEDADGPAPARLLEP